MGLLPRLLEIVIVTISAVGALVVLWGVGETLVAFGRFKLGHLRRDAVPRSEEIRQNLGAHLLLGLEIFIAADIIGSAVSPTWQKVGTLAAIVAIRTVLSYFLRVELKQGV